jgi:biopolymer transport protein ExbD
MAFSAAGTSGRPLADINVTPLVDVMLVLLIIFIVTAPMVAVPIPVDLPQRSERWVPRPDPPPPIELRVDAGNQLFWNGQPIGRATLQAQLQEQAQAHAGNLPELRIDASPDAQYEVMAQVLADASNAHMQRISFVR